MKIRIAILSLLALGCVGLLSAQNITTVTPDVEVTYAQRIGHTLPIRQLVPMAPADPEKRKRFKLNKEVPNNFAGRGKYVSSNPDALPQGPDAVWQRTVRNNNSLEVEPLVNIEGLSNGGSPHDPSGDIGRDYYMQAVNATMLAVFDKEGNLVTAFSANTIWNSIGFSSAGDPIIMFDQEAGRWIITEFPSGNQLLVGVSDTSDPLGSYTAYNFGTPNFPDYPKYGIWSNAYSVTTNESGPNNLPCYFINREQMLNGEPSVMIQRIVLDGIGSGPGFQVATPVDWTGLTPPMDDAPVVLTLDDDAWGESTDDMVKVHTFNLDWDNPDNTTIEVTDLVATPFDTNPCSVPGFGFSCMPQLNGGGLDGLPEVIMNQPHYRNFGTHESMVLNFITDVTGGDNLSGIRWMELRRVSGGDWEVYQEGTFAPDDGLDRYMGSICMDGAGNIGLAYAVSSEEIYVGTRFTGRRASDPLGEMTVTEYNLSDGQSTINSGARFGDYGHMSVDPTNDRTFWFTGEYAGSNGTSTRIMAFELARDTIDIGPVALESPQNSSDLTDSETVAVRVTNFGLDTINAFQVGYIFEGGSPVIDNITTALLPDSSYNHTFVPTVDMSAIGNYDFLIFTNLLGDQAIFNDTLRLVRSQLPRFDIGVIDLQGLDEINCGETASVTAVIANFGTQTITTFTLTVNLNGTLLVVEWEGTLLPGENTTIDIDLEDLLNGTNTIEAATSVPNGNTDEVMENDAFARPLEALVDGVEATLELLTDIYPSETTWELTDEDGTILYSGGPYDTPVQLYTESFCLDEESCYDFTIYDSYGDGICCAFGDGGYSIVNEDGIALLDSDGQFSSVETNNFCATFQCNLDADIDVSPESAPGESDGVIFLTPLNGVGPYQYSIDGGQTFQDDNFFGGLAGGEYDVVILGEADCEYSGTATVGQCALQLSVGIQDASVPDAEDGSITISVNNGSSPYQYSIDGGETFQNEPVFENIGGGEYAIVVQDFLGCAVEIDAVVGVINNVFSIDNGYRVSVAPNPTTGAFFVTIEGLQHTRYTLPVEIYNANGQLIQAWNLSRYNGDFTGRLSVYNYPNGAYYIRFIHPDMNQMVKIIKQ